MTFRPRALAVRFLQEFLLQVIAFRRRNPAVYVSSPEICELSKLAPSQDAAWFERLIEKCDIDSPACDERSFMRNSLSGPLRASAAGVRTFVMFDDLHNAMHIENGQRLKAEIVDIFSRTNVPHLFLARRRFPMSGRVLRLSSSRSGAENRGRVCRRGSGGDECRDKRPDPRPDRGPNGRTCRFYAIAGCGQRGRRATARQLSACRAGLYG